MTDDACRPARQPQIIARGVDFTMQELQGMERAFRKARASSEGARDGELVMRVIRACLSARKAA